MELNDYLPKQECQFLHHVQDDLETYQKRSNHTCVLLFPPLPARLRYLIHSHIEDQPELTSFSVGEGRGRRLVVCNSQLRSDVEGETDSQSYYSLCDKHLTSRGKQGEASSSKSSIKARSRGPKRPDKPLYMPRAARERLSLQNSQEPSGERASTGPAACHCSCISGSSDSCSCPKTTENTKSSTTATQECLPSETDRISNSVTDSPELCQGALAQVLDQSVALFADMTLEEDEKDKEFPSSVPSRELTEEITSHLKEGLTVSIEHVHNDYSVYASMCVNINPEEFRHVIEIYDFPAIFETDDLVDAFAECSDGGMKIKWVDNTHALGVFASEAAAIHAISICHPLLKTRSLAEGSKKAQATAIRSAEFIQPVKERPKTDCAVAQRMVTRALGLQRGGRVRRY